VASRGDDFDGKKSPPFLPRRNGLLHRSKQRFSPLNSSDR
jgi:hypothetical protein